VNLRNLTFAGWMLALASIGVIVLVSIPVGRWALDHIDRSVLRNWIDWIVIALSLAGVAAGLASFAVGQKVLARCGVKVSRPTSSSGPGRHDGWILWAVVIGLNVLVWTAFFLFAM